MKTGYKDICIRSSYRKTAAGLILLYKVFNSYKEVNTPKFFISKVNKGHDKQMKTLMRTVIGNEKKSRLHLLTCKILFENNALIAFFFVQIR